MKKLLLSLIVISVGGIVAYKIGPKPIVFSLSPQVSSEVKERVSALNNIEEYVKRDLLENEIRLHNESKLYWADAINQKTSYVLLYLHGFSASPEEGNPVHKDIAKKYGMNLYVPRLSDHGLVESEPMINFTAERYIRSAQEALAVANKLGDSIIIMSTSTGSTAALYLASSAENNISGLICYSPNIKVFDPKASLLAGPWGLQIARLVKGTNYHTWEAPRGADSFWHTRYRLEALVELQRLIEGTMTEEVFSSITVPTLVGYYHKNAEEQDSVVDVEAIQKMYNQLGSDRKQLVAFPNAGKHCMPSKYFGKDIPNLKTRTSMFLEKWHIGLHVNANIY